MTAVDAAPEMLDRLRRRVAGHHVTTIEADLFAWRPPRTFDAIVSCFFMSHVPDGRLEWFLALLASSIREGGLVFLLDSARTELSTAADHELPRDGDQAMRRRLNSSAPSRS